MYGDMAGGPGTVINGAPSGNGMICYSRGHTYVHSHLSLCEGQIRCGWSHCR